LLWEQERAMSQVPDESLGYESQSAIQHPI
jgi:hypothetical protein